MPASNSPLFQSSTVGDITLAHRVVMAPLTRFRADDTHTMQPLNQEYYEQRADAPGTLMITEATLIAPQAGGYPNPPGIWSEDQIAGWRKIVNAIHAKGSFTFLQLWDLGAAAEKPVLDAAGLPYISASDVLFEGAAAPPRPMTVAEIHEHTALFAVAARNAVEKAGFDGVEVHSANGYLLDQFIQTNTNKRTDEYGGSVENRIRFSLEVLDAVVEVVGAKKTAIRLSPWSHFQGMRMPDPVPTFTELVTRIRDNHPDLAYIHVVEPRVDGSFDREVAAHESNDFIRKIWGRRIVAAGGFTRESGLEHAATTDDLIAYGRYFIANPDLVRRLKEDLPLTKGNRPTYYGDGQRNARPGYVDYPFAPSAAEPSPPSERASAQSHCAGSTVESLLQPIAQLLKEASLAPSRKAQA